MFALKLSVFALKLNPVCWIPFTRKFTFELLSTLKMVAETLKLLYVVM